MCGGQIKQLQGECSDLDRQVITLKGKCEEIEQKERQRRAADDEKHAEEVLCVCCGVKCDVCCRVPVCPWGLDCNVDVVWFTCGVGVVLGRAGGKASKCERSPQKVAGIAVGGAKEVNSGRTENHLVSLYDLPPSWKPFPATLRAFVFAAGFVT